MNWILVTSAHFSSFAFHWPFEKVTYSRLKSSVELNELLYSSQLQYGFGENMSTQHAIVDIVNLIIFKAIWVTNCLGPSCTGLFIKGRSLFYKNKVFSCSLLGVDLMLFHCLSLLMSYPLICFILKQYVLLCRTYVPFVLLGISVIFSPVYPLDFLKLVVLNLY